jgi:hypothetical protein
MTQDDLLQKIAERLERMETEQKRQGEVQAKQGNAVERIEGKLVLLTEDMSGFFHKTWEKMDKQDERITALEEHTGITKHN